MISSRLCFLSQCLLFFLISCSPNVPTEANYDNCTGSQICAYDAHSSFIGHVQNKDNTGDMEIITLKGYHIYLNNKDQEVDSSYSKFKLATKTWPISESDGSLSVLWSVSDSTTKEKTLLSFTTTSDGGEKIPLQVCFDGEPQDVSSSLGYEELSRITEDNTYPGVFQYEFQSVPVLSGKYLALTVCDEDTTGVSNYITNHFDLRNAHGISYTGTVSSGMCQKGISSCLL